MKRFKKRQIYFLPVLVDFLTLHSVFQSTHKHFRPFQQRPESLLKRIRHQFADCFYLIFVFLFPQRLPHLFFLSGLSINRRFCSSSLRGFSPAVCLVVCVNSVSLLYCSYLKKIEGTDGDICNLAGKIFHYRKINKNRYFPSLRGQFVKD